MTSPLPPPIPGTAVDATRQDTSVERADHGQHTLPLVAAIGAIVVLSGSLILSKYLLDAIVEQGWPVAVYVLLLAGAGYGPSLWWCWFASRRWGTGELGADIGLRARVADIGWGPLVWLAAIAAQIAVGIVVVALDLPLVGNTEGLDEISADRTYVVSLVIAAVVAAPLVEEMVFRGVVMRGLLSRLPLVAVVVVQGVLFGLAHVDPVRGSGNIGLVLVLGGVGVAFGTATVIFGRLGPSIVAHAIFNGAVLVIVLTGVVDRLDDRAGSAGEQVGVVDQADVSEADGDGDACSSRSTVIGVESVDRAERCAVEDRHVLEGRQRFVGDDRTGSVDHVTDRGA